MSADIRDLTVMFYMQGSTCWHYRTATGTFSDVCADGYFDKMSDMMSSGDFILLSASDGAAQAHVRKSGGAVRLSVMCRTVAEEQTLPKPDASDPHQALKDAVIAAAGEVRITHPLTDERFQAIIKMFYAIDALTAAQNPPKPDLVEVFYEVAGYNLSVCRPETWKLCRSKPDECACRHYITEGLAAVDAARGAK